MFNLHRGDPFNIIINCINGNAWEMEVAIIMILFDGETEVYAEQGEFILQSEANRIVFGPFVISADFDEGKIFSAHVEIWGGAGIILSEDIYGFLRVTLDGDVNGDGVVDDADLNIVGDAYGSVPGNANWNRNADLNNDGRIDIVDLGIVGYNYGRSL